MAPNSDNSDNGQPGPNQKTLHVWSKPIEQNDQVPGSPDVGSRPDGSKTDTKSPISQAISMIKAEDFTNVAGTPCARQGFITGIASGAGIGGLKFVLRGNATKAANWAVGTFMLGSILSYEYCQYQRRAEKMQMKRHIEIVSETRKDQAKKLAEAKLEHERIQIEKKAAERRWYKFW